MENDTDPFFIALQKEKMQISHTLSNIKHKIGIYSAKGGVGKTTIAVNLAYALSKKNFKVGILDADIDCPNVTFFFGISDRIAEMPFKPIEKYGVKVLSTAMLVDDASKPIIWRGPLIAKMINDFLMHSEWGELDYLIIDLPPGTSDAPLTIMQVLDMDGFVLVTTPQKIAAVNAQRSGLMAKRLGKAVLGIVENMSNGNEENSKALARELGAAFLGSIPYAKEFSEYSDNGKVPALEDQRIFEIFSKIADALTA
ncbi:MAG: P-loop NTPase [Candidatus Micrarchaeaceae archaeon]